jgi:hypothetical protein
MVKKLYVDVLIYITYYNIGDIFNQFFLTSVSVKIASEIDSIPSAKNLPVGKYIDLIQIHRKNKFHRSLTFSSFLLMNILSIN